MKSRFQNNLDGAADMGTYFELSLQRFIIQMPQYAGMLAGAPIDYSDPRYIVRFRFLKNGRIDLEVGYPEDSEWRIGQSDTSKQLSYPSANEEIETGRLVQRILCRHRCKECKRIARYIQNQLREDQLSDQMTLREFENSFMGGR